MVPYSGKIHVARVGMLSIVKIKTMKISTTELLSLKMALYLKTVEQTSVYICLLFAPLHNGQSTCLTKSTQWRRKIVEFRGAEARRHAALPCFSPANIELFIICNDDSLLLSWVHSDSLPSDSDKLSTSTLLSILHLFASLTRKEQERCNGTVTCDQNYYSTNRVKLFKILFG